jgi:hypothetical protein
MKWTIGISRSDRGIIGFIPGYDFLLIRREREKYYRTIHLIEFLDERRIKNVITTSSDLEIHRKQWLNDEFKEVDRLINIPDISKSDRVELQKYKDFVLSEIERPSPSVRTKTVKPYKSKRRFISFIIAEAYFNHNQTFWKDCSKKDFAINLKKIFNVPDSIQYFQTVRSSYKDEKNYLNYYDKMKEIYKQDYEYAMDHLKDYYPENKV